MPENDDHALPLRIERSATELRIEAQKVVAQLAAHLTVDANSDGTSFGAAIDEKARLLDPVRAPKVSTALRRALDQLRMAAAGRSYRDASGPPTPQQALQTLQAAVGPQQQVVTTRRQAAAAAEAAAEEQTAAQEQAAAEGEQRGLDALSEAILALPAINGDDPEAARARVDLIRGSLHVIVELGFPARPGTLHRTVPAGRPARGVYDRVHRAGYHWLHRDLEVSRRPASLAWRRPGGQ
jgi:hypothetical protein